MKYSIILLALCMICTLSCKKNVDAGADINFGMKLLLMGLQILFILMEIIIVHLEKVKVIPVTMERSG